jgi:hypothetical protein
MIESNLLCNGADNGNGFDRGAHVMNAHDGRTGGRGQHRACQGSRVA